MRPTIVDRPAGRQAGEAKPAGTVASDYAA